VSGPLTIDLRRAADKDIQRLPKFDAERVAERIAAYGENPQAPGHDVLQLVGTQSLFRLRVGDWRVIFRLNGEHMIILRVLHRREAYR
jgi:mRNA interferase RelE/StbE